MAHEDFDAVAALSEELSLPAWQVERACALLSEGATVPFVARYRKEATGGLDEVQLRQLEERHGALLELHQRRLVILASVQEQGALSPALEARIRACQTRAELEDLYLPYRPKRRTRATRARELGLEPLAQKILAQPPTGSPEAEARRFVVGEVADVEAALAGARDIVAEVASEDADWRAYARDQVRRFGVLRSQAAKGKEDGEDNYAMYKDFHEPIGRAASHRLLAVLRGEREGALKVKVEVDGERVVARGLALLRYQARSPWGAALKEAVEDGYKRLLEPAVTREVLGDARERAEREAVEVFAENLRDLLMAAPLGSMAVLGVDPGLRTGCKCAALDETGRYLGTETLFLTHGEGRKEEARRLLLGLVRKHQIKAVAVGNGTGGRDAEGFVREVLREAGIGDVTVVMVHEAGASVYSASEVARQEFPALDLTIRGAISIGRRLQDPLAELVKIEPRSIGVGQYQHDVDQKMLERKLGEVVESCVNQVGVELNTASAPLLSYVSGVGPKLAQRIVEFRQENGAFTSRQQLKKVSGLGPKTFEQAAGFLRVRESANPLDNSAVHPERYKLVEAIARDLGVALGALVGDSARAAQIPVPRYVSAEVGEPTLRDIVAELGKPGRDPRASFEVAKFREDVTSPEHLKPGMTLEGMVTNVTHFGAFVDIGVKQDGLVHISQLSDRFVRDPREVVRAGERVQVRVLEVDLGRKRISLTMKGLR